MGWHDMKSSKFQVPSSKNKQKKNTSLRLLFTVLVLCGLYVLVKNLYSSAFFQKKDRVNIVVSTETVAFYSLGLDDGVNYFASFFPDLEVVVPGGYGYYRLGALSKLVDLEKTPDLLKRTLSLMTSNFNDYYFYPSRSKDKINVHFGRDQKEFSTPSFNLTFFGKSNASFFDRLYIYMKLFSKTKGQFRIISLLPYINVGSRQVFSNQDFFDRYQGNFYKKTYRNEQRTVQILYTKSYKTAKMIGQMVEGEGIRVVDFSDKSGTSKECEIVEDTKNFSQTAKALSQFFNCKLLQNKTDPYDIIFKLNRVEKEWEVDL